jgi:hypothetical protein
MPVKLEKPGNINILKQNIFCIQHQVFYIYLKNHDFIYPLVYKLPNNGIYIIFINQI